MPVNSFADYPMTWKPKLEKTGMPIYLELARLLENDIESGALRPGTRLPPQRELADFLDINLSTVSRAFKLCADNGLLTSCVGSGTYVSFSSLTRLIEEPRNELIRLDAMTPETLEPSELVDVTLKMLSESGRERLFQYELDQASWQNEAACRLLQRAGSTTQSGHILTAGGGQNAIAAIFAALLTRGGKLGVDPLTYPGVKSAAKLFGIQLVPIALENGHMSEEGIKYAVKNDGVRALFVMPDYQNPTAYVMSTDERQMIANLAIENDLLLIEDGICNLLSDKLGSIHDYAPENTVFTLSLSKTVCPALKTAYIAAPEKYHDRLDNALYTINLSQSALLNELAARFIASDNLDSFLTRRIKGIEMRNDLVNIILKDFTVRGNHHSLARWLVLPDGISSEYFEKEMASRGVSVYGSEHFAVGKSVTESGVRLAVCSPDSIDELEYALKIIRNFLEQLCCKQF